LGIASGETAEGTRRTAETMDKTDSASNSGDIKPGAQYNKPPRAEINKSKPQVPSVSNKQFYRHMRGSDYNDSSSGVKSGVLSQSVDRNQIKASRQGYHQS
jgi:hypothetical protein